MRRALESTDTSDAVAADRDAGHVQGDGILAAEVVKQPTIQFIFLQIALNLS